MVLATRPDASCFKELTSNRRKPIATRSSKRQDLSPE
jgi:hypothetical protein